eukprot:5992005-Prymnesium_polylepis.2
MGAALAQGAHPLRVGTRAEREGVGVTEGLEEELVLRDVALEVGLGQRAVRQRAHEAALGALPREGDHLAVGPQRRREPRHRGRAERPGRERVVEWADGARADAERRRRLEDALEVRPRRAHRRKRVRRLTGVRLLCELSRDRRRQCAAGAVRVARGHALARELDDAVAAVRVHVDDRAAAVRAALHQPAALDQDRLRARVE